MPCYKVHVQLFSCPFSLNFCTSQAFFRHVLTKSNQLRTISDNRLVSSSTGSNYRSLIHMATNKPSVCYMKSSLGSTAVICWILALFVYKLALLHKKSLCSSLVSSLPNEYTLPSLNWASQTQYSQSFLKIQDTLVTSSPKCHIIWCYLARCREEF